MKNPIMWLLFGLLFALTVWFLSETLQQYLLDARNAQG